MSLTSVPEIYNQELIIDVCTNPHSSPTEIDNALAQTIMDEWEIVLNSILTSSHTPVYTLQTVTYFIINHFPVVPTPRSQFYEILAHPNVTPEIIHQIVVHIMDNSTITDMGVMFKNYFAPVNSCIHSALKNPKASVETILLILEKTTIFAQDIVLHPNTPGFVFDKMLDPASDLGARLPGDVVSLILANAKTSADAIATYLNTVMPNWAAQKIIAQREDWKQVLVLVLKSEYPEVTTMLPLQWLEEILTLEEDKRRDLLFANRKKTKV